jgi:hypothetical protein
MGGLLGFYYCQIAGIISLYKGKVCFGALFQKSPSMVTWAHCLWAYDKAAAHHDRAHMVEEAGHLMVARKQKKERRGAKVPILSSMT